MGFAFHAMSEKVAKDPAAAAAELKALVDKGATCATIAEKYEVTLRTVGRWLSRLRSVLGAEQLGFALREGRRPGSKNARPRRDKGRKTGPLKKKRRAPKKGVANSDMMA